MLVFNLQNYVLDFHGKKIPADGGSLNFTELDPPGFIPDRDRKLESDKIIAFGKLPYWWALEQELKSKRKFLTRQEVRERDGKRAELAEEKIKAGHDPLQAVAEAVAGKIGDELKSESRTRELVKVVPYGLKEQKRRK